MALQHYTPVIVFILCIFQGWLILSVH
jgi:hypothetical protein